MPLQALRLFGSLRLGAIIFDIRKAGHKVTTELIKVAPEKRVAKYKLVRG